MSSGVACSAGDLVEQASNLCDDFGVLMIASGSAATQWRSLGRFIEEEGLVAGAGGGGDVLVGRGVAMSAAMASKVPNCSVKMSPGACFICLTRMGVPCDKAKAMCGSHVVCQPPPTWHGCGILASLMCGLSCSPNMAQCLVDSDGIEHCDCTGGDPEPLRVSAIRTVGCLAVTTDTIDRTGR